MCDSDAKEVIYHRVGLDHGAAQLLKQALQFNRSRSGVAHTSTLRGTVQQADNGASTFLAALLGPEVEAVALREARRKRCGRPSLFIEQRQVQDQLHPTSWRPAWDLASRSLKLLMV
eukprot:scaffold104990_cov11-Tisochrysis_lutea.AAC.1